MSHRHVHAWIKVKEEWSNKRKQNWWEWTNETLGEEKWGEPLARLIPVGGKPSISGRKRPWASAEMKIGNIDSSYLYGERKKERTNRARGLHFKRSRLHFCRHLSVFGAWTRKWVRFLLGSLLQYGCMRKQQGSGEVTGTRACVLRSSTRGVIEFIQALKCLSPSPLFIGAPWKRTATIPLTNRHSDAKRCNESDFWDKCQN